MHSLELHSHIKANPASWCDVDAIQRDYRCRGAIWRQYIWEWTSRRQLHTLQQECSSKSQHTIYGNHLSTMHLQMTQTHPTHHRHITQHKEGIITFCTRLLFAQDAMRNWRWQNHAHWEALPWSKSWLTKLGRQATWQQCNFNGLIQTCLWTFIFHWKIERYILLIFIYIPLVLPILLQGECWKFISYGFNLLVA